MLFEHLTEQQDSLPFFCRLFVVQPDQEGIVGGTDFQFTLLLLLLIGRVKQSAKKGSFQSQSALHYDRLSQVEFGTLDEESRWYLLESFESVAYVQGSIDDYLSEQALFYLIVVGLLVLSLYSA